jgi:hypothetical protein
MSVRNQSTETLGKIMNCTAVCAEKAIIPSANEFGRKYQSLMQYLCTFIDKFFDNTKTLSNDIFYMNIVYCILSMVWNLTDRVPLVPMFLDAGYANSIVKWIKKLSSGYPWSQLHEQVISINHNLCRHKMGLYILRENDAFKILMKYKPLLKWENDSQLDDMTQAFAMSLIALATNDNDQAENKDLICKACEKLYRLCEKAAKEPSLRKDGFHLSELLHSLEWALFNTTVVRHMLGNHPNVNKESIQFFAQLLISFYGTLLNPEANDHEKSIVRSLLKILLCISSYHDYREELQSHGPFCILIESLTTRPKQDIPKRIWANLELDEKPNPSSHPIILNKPPMIYINYNWKDIDFCVSFVDDLSKLTKVPIWVDYENANWFDDMWDHIAYPLKHATIVVVLVSDAYCNSVTNFQELSYAIETAETQSGRKKDSIIFVETECDVINRREWISNVSKDKKLIFYNENQQEIARKVIEHDTFSKKKLASFTYSHDNAAQSRVCTIM